MFDIIIYMFYIYISKGHKEKTLLRKQTLNQLKQMKTLLNILGIIYITGLVLSIITLVLIAVKAF